MLTSPEEWATTLTQFLALLDSERWSRRVSQLIGDAERSPYGAKIVADYHWLEMELAGQSTVLADTGSLLPGLLDLRSAAALKFASIVVDLNRELSVLGRRVLDGRLRDALNTGFSGLFLELDMASMLLDSGCRVGFPDFEGCATHDLDVVYEGTELAVECKSISVDAGRKIHRRDFYRFLSMIEVDLVSRSRLPANVVVVVTMVDRFPADTGQQRDIAETIFDAVGGPANNILRRRLYNVYWEPIDLLTAGSERVGTDFSAICRERFGHNCHAAGQLTDYGGYLIVVRSEREDDPSRASLEARKAAVKQLPADRPAIVALQYEDITVQDLSKPNFRQRAIILDNVILRDGRAAHVAAFYHCAFDGLWASDGQLGKPAFAIWSNKWRNKLTNFPLADGINYSSFAELLRSVPSESSDFSKSRFVRKWSGDTSAE